jgi:hypothetical protein
MQKGLPMTSEHDYLIGIRAAHLQQAKALQQERAAILEIVAIIERKLGMNKLASEKPADEKSEVVENLKI